MGTRSRRRDGDERSTPVRGRAVVDQGERWWIEQVGALVAEAGFITFLPHHNPPKDQTQRPPTFFENDERHGVNEYDVVVASLNGVATDDGTAWELGYAYATGKHLIGLHHWRMRASPTRS